MDTSLKYLKISSLSNEEALQKVEENVLGKTTKFVLTYWHCGPHKKKTVTEKFTFPFQIHQKDFSHSLCSQTIKVRWENKNRRYFGRNLRTEQVG